jgi:multidrug efflux pump subunit AcrA (membrane-fusion protein)
MTAKRLVRTLAPLLLALAIGVFAGVRFSGDGEQSSPIGEIGGGEERGSCPGGATPAYWQAPMDPSFIRQQPGKSPMGMDLVPVCADEAGSSGSGVVQVDSATVQTIGVRTAPVEIRDLSRSVRAVGRVAYDERRVAHVHTKVQGWIEHLYVDFVGQAVKRGQPLLEIYSPELVATQEELLLAARYKRATGDSPFEDVKSSGSSLLDATRRRLQLWDVSGADIDRLLESGEVKRTLTLHAPASGVVTMLAVRSGMEVAPNANLYTIADLSTVWVVADVYEYELPWIELGQTGKVELSYLPGFSFSGPVSYISPFLDPKTRTAEVRLELPNTEGRLKPEMFANTLIEAALRPGATAIPSEAVIRSGRRTLAIVALGEGRFTAREVELGLQTGDGWTEITQGLQPGEEVVVSSQFLIDSESNLQEAVQKLLYAEPRAAERGGAVPPATGSREAH